MGGGGGSLKRPVVTEDKYNKCDDAKVFKI